MARPRKTSNNQPATDVGLSENWRQEVAARFVTARKITGCTQAALAERFDCSPRTISRWENGQIVPRARALLKYKRAYGGTVQWLLDGSTVGLPPRVAAKIERMSSGLTQRQRES